VDAVLSQASHVVSQASGHVGFAIRPAHEAAVFDRVEFIPLGAMRVLVVIVARGGHVPEDDRLDEPFTLRTAESAAT
jgi:transcriptional regulator of heat shock response